MIRQGLNENQVLESRQKFGENILPTKENNSWFIILLSQFKSPLIYILVATAIISLILKEYINAGLMALVVTFNLLMGFFQEYNAQKTLIALKNLLKPETIVIRDGINKKIEAKDIVVGDLVVLGPGDKIPADGELIEDVNFLVKEAILTGEEEAILKSSIDKNNLVFMGTVVIYGRGIMKVTKIGTQTEIGKIGQSLAEIKEEKTPLQIKLEKFATKLVYLIIVICSIIFLVGILRHQNILQMLKMSIILAVAAIPEGLPVAIMVILSLGMKKVLKRKGLVKKLLAMETLGVTSVICTDKTGTLTEGVMKVVKTDFMDQEKALLGLTLANNQRSNLETAIWDYIRKKHFNPQDIFNSMARTFEEPFDNEKKYMLSINQIDGNEAASIIGAPEIILQMCDIEADKKQDILEKISCWAEEGLKVLGVISKNQGDLKDKNNFTWLGLIGIQDPIRKGVKEAIRVAMEAGIKVKIVTGDYRKTAEKIARSLGFNITEKNIMEGSTLEIISEDELKEKIDDIIIFSRVTPRQKLKIVKVLQEKGEVVAMTGDGINDATALKKADIGIAVNNATDVAKEAADLILLNNNFKTIIAACKEGRLIFSNIKKVVAYVLSNSFAEIVLIFGAILMGLPTPLTIIQILWAHLICDGPPDIVLGFETRNKALHEEDPKILRREEILDKPIIALIILISLTVGLSSLFIFTYFLKQTGQINLARTITFATVATVDLIYIFAFKDLKNSLFKTKNLFDNKRLIWAVIYGLLLVVAAIYIPVLNKVLETMPLKPFYWFIVIGVALITVFWVELIKYIKNGRNSNNQMPVENNN
ncbi:MAG: HAD-IC family P-type ATPase [Patescibacteria group bacterium]|nr:HAD-IC family P-type ATPase [Patescibacteria group bacterium]MDD5164850.1 HAD-IC family P-type ATPase [Patescibacteria group bacterium]MDD5534682.1 HAD-IC family P-type ATPase [Patescibacteria group bacterium]